MKICNISYNFLPTTAGGVEQYIINMSKCLQGSNIDSVLVIPRTATLPKVQKFDNLICYRLDFCKLPYKYLSAQDEVAVEKQKHTSFFSSAPIIAYQTFKESFDFPLSGYLWLKKNNQAQDIDCFNAHSSFYHNSLLGRDSALLLGLKFRKWSKKPLVITFHQKFGNESGDFPLKAKKYLPYFKGADRIICHRKSTGKVFDDWGLGEKCIFMPMAIDSKRYSRPAKYNYERDRKISLLFSANLNVRKDPLTALRAFMLLNQTHRNTELHVVGYGPLEQVLKQFVSRNNLGAYIHFYGKQYDVREFLWRSSIFLSLNTSDNYPSLALREAMAAGLVPIVTDVGDTADLIVDGENGLLIPPHDPIALSRAIIMLIEDANLLRKISQNCLLAAKRFDLTNLRNEYLKIYSDVCNGRKN